VVNNSSADAHFVITYIVAEGVAKRTDEPHPDARRAGSAVKGRLSQVS